MTYANYVKRPEVVIGPLALSKNTHGFTRKKNCQLNQGANVESENNNQKPLTHSELLKRKIKGIKVDLDLVQFEQLRDIQSYLFAIDACTSYPSYSDCVAWLVQSFHATVVSEAKKSE